MEEMKGGKMSESDTITIKKDQIWKYSTVILLAIVVVGGFIMFSGNNPATGSAIVNTGDSGTGSSVTIPEAGDDPFLGPEDADIVVIEFSDFECPWCAIASGLNEDLLISARNQLGQNYEPAVPVLKQLAAEGKIKFVYKDFPAHANSQKAAEAAQCANEQGKYWEYHDTLFENFGALSISQLKGYASELGLDTGSFDECLDSGKYASEVQRDLAEARAAGVRGTPGFYINDQLISGAAPAEDFLSIIESL